MHGANYPKSALQKLVIADNSLRPAVQTATLSAPSLCCNPRKWHRPLPAPKDAFWTYHSNASLRCRRGRSRLDAFRAAYCLFPDKTRAAQWFRKQSRYPWAPGCRFLFALCARSLLPDTRQKTRTIRRKRRSTTMEVSPLFENRPTQLYVS